MSGLCAVVARRNASRARELLAELSHASKIQPCEKVRWKFELGGGIGIAARLCTQQFFESSHILLACDADLSNESELRGMLDVTDPAEIITTAALLTALYEKFGSVFVEKLRGAFSLVIWDRHQNRLVVSIDGFGIHRLALYDHPDFLLIASRVDALAQSGEIDTSVNPCAIANILNFSSNLAPHTILRHVTRLLPGTVLTVQDGNITTRRYWTMQYGGAQHVDEESLSNELEALVEHSVEDHSKDLDFDNIGSFLSGGTDSSTVVGMMSRLNRGPVHAFSIGFREQSFNELDYAKLAAKQFGAQHHVCLVGPEDCSRALPDIVRAFDEPFGNASAVPTYFCAKLAADHGIDVLLAGDGGDELFAGNERYATDKVFDTYQRVPGLLRRGLIEPLLACVPFEAGMFAKAKRYVRRSNLCPVERYFSYHFLRANRAADIFESDFLASMQDYSPLDIPALYYRDALAHHHLDRLLYIDIHITLADNDLPKVTRMSELAGIRSRFPFLDHAVAEFSGRVPASLKINGFKKRYLFKRAFRNLLPVGILKKKKHGFGIPVAMWLNSDSGLREISRDVLFSRTARERGFFRRSFIDDLVRKTETEESTYYGDTLWTFFVCELWCQQVLDQRKTVAR